ncbi:MAG: glycosyltransferase family 2 protein [Terriglobia bacterium]
MRSQRDVESPGSDLDWRVRRTWRSSVGMFLVHTLVIAVLYSLSFPGRHRFFWCAAVAYYWFFYFRMVRFALWTSGTLDLITRTTHSCPSARLETLAGRSAWPRFVLCVPAWGSGRCIGLTASVVNHLRYPRELWRVVFVSDQLELDIVNARSHEIGKDIFDALVNRTAPTSISIEHAALLLYLVDGGQTRSIDYVLLFGPSRTAASRAWAGLLAALARRGIGPDGCVPERVCERLNSLVREHSLAAREATTQVATMMGIPADVLPDSAGSANWADPLLLQRISRQLHRAIPGLQGADTAGVLRERLLSGAIEEGIATAYHKSNPSTKEAVEACLARLGAANMHHFLRPRGVRNKASALNYAFLQAERHGWLDDETHVIVLDSDSLLHPDALAIAALEILRDPERNVIRQLLPITTTNFSGRNWLVRTIIAADSMAAPGRWASNVRTERRADLTAGSGVIIPTSLLRYLRHAYGEPWDSKIICEDARMIMSQYAILDGATKKTRMVPAYVLEGAPEQDTAWRTYVAFWHQRVRWAVGGFDEVVALFRTSSKSVLVRSLDFSHPSVTPLQRVAAMGRKLHLTFAWLKEHLWWSGIVLAPFLWIAAEATCGAATWSVRCIGLLLLFVVPGALLRYIFARQIAPLIPGGVSSRQLLALLILLVLMGLPYILPVVAGQVLCITGVRRRLARRQWNPATPKPGSQCNVGARIRAATPEERK